ncbi:MAG: hypothetical protein WAL45_08100 [Terracidiphilus sp.]
MMAQLRLDPETRRVLDGLEKRKGWTTSEILRKGIHMVAREAAEDMPFKIHGLGEFDFGVSDLSTNKKYMEGYGRSSMPGGKSRKKTVKR